MLRCHLSAILLTRHPTRACDDGFAARLRQAGATDFQVYRVTVRRTIAALKASGLSNRQVADRVGLSDHRVWVILGEMNGSAPNVDRIATVDGRTMPARKPSAAELAERRRLVRRLADEGMPRDRIAAHVGIGRSTLFRDLAATR